MPSMPSFNLRKRGIAIAGSVAAVGLAATAAVALPGNGVSSAVADPNAQTVIARASAQASQEAAAKDAAAKAAATKADAAKAAAEKQAAAAKKAADEKADAAKAAADKAAAEKQAAAAKKAADEKAAAEKAAAENEKAAAQRAAQQAANRSMQRQPLQQAPAAPSGSPQEIAAQIVPADQLASFDQIISHESGWNVTATNPSSGAYGLGQALPGSKMASAGADWQTNAATQIRWALSYMDSTFGSPNAAWSFWQAHNWY